MGIFIDKGNIAFKEIKNSDFVDKSGLMQILNDNIATTHRYICVASSAFWKVRCRKDDLCLLRPEV